LNTKKIIPIAFVSVFLLSAVLGGTRAQGSHDVAIVDVYLCVHLPSGIWLSLGGIPPDPTTKAEAYPTWKALYINVTAKNNGTFVETFNVTAYCNETAIGIKNVTLAPEENKTLTFTWDNIPYPTAWPYPVYTVSANASVVPDEVYTDNNVFIDGTVKVKLPGDTNGDGKVNAIDLGGVGFSWLSGYGEWRYDPRRDFNGDGKINVLDLGILGINWGYVVPGADP